MLLVADSQGELPLTRASKQQPVSDEVIRACRSFLEAFNLQVNVSGLDEKEIYISLKIEASHWSRMRKGEVHFPLNKLNDLCEVCGNEVALSWWARSRGKGLHMLLTEAERLLIAERERAEKAEAENRLLRELVRGGK